MSSAKMAAMLSRGGWLKACHQSAWRYVNGYFETHEWNDLQYSWFTAYRAALFPSLHDQMKGGTISIQIEVETKASTIVWDMQSRTG